MSVVIETTLGDVTVDLYTSERPRACLNFLKLCKMKYYNYNLFHTISRGFIAQTGDPTGSRSGGESLYGVLDGSSRRYFESENEPRIKHTKMGLISFVGNDERMIGSQFFITLGEDLTYLDQKHCVFGEVVEGFDVLEELNEVICDVDDRPYKDVRITHTVILDDPYPNPEKLIVPSRSPSPSEERLKGGRIAPDEEIDETEGKTAQEIAEIQAEREAKARATILEMVGDLPDAEMAPPENVLFVCKLNPVTTDDDLEIIFNRFGTIVSCEVIRDRKSGDSLQYAFIEFSDRKACEDAYFKMDNILIDDRRIHVDFSQSVSKVKWLGKGRGVQHFDEKGRKTTNPNNSVGKGNYKVNKRYGADSTNNGHEDISKRNKERTPMSPIRDAVKENNSRHKKDEYDENYYKTSRKHRREKTDESPSREHHNKNRYKEDSSRSERRNSPRKSYSRENEFRDRRRSDRDRSRSPSRNETFRNRRCIPSRERRDNFSYRREEQSRRYGRDTIGSNREYSRNKYESKEMNRRRSRSRSYDKRSELNGNLRYDRNEGSSSKNSERNEKSNDHKTRVSGHGNMSKQSQKKDKENIRARTDSKSSDSEIEKRKNKRKGKKENCSSTKERNSKKHKKEKVESSSDSESSDSDSESSDSDTESSGSDSEKSKKVKKLSSKKIKKRNKSDSSSESSGSSDSSESESSSDSEEEKKKTKKLKKRKYKSSSDSEASEKKKRKKNKK